MRADGAAALVPLETFHRYKVDRLRQASTVLEPQERLDPISSYWKTSANPRGEELAALRGLRDTAELPSFMLPTHTYHESIPGHHVKLSIYQEAKLPLIRKTAFFSAYLEGWSFYAEQLSDEMGMYDDDPFGRIGYLHGAMRASVALVVDTGLHAMRWSREQSIQYFADTLGDPVRSATTEVERYCIWPGQVCSYALDKLMILRLRDKAKTALGSRFDIAKFHDALLSCGAVPQKVLESVVDDYIKAANA